MARELQPEDVLKSLEKGKLAPFYLFYGPGEFRLEKVLDKIRGDFIPESARDFNVEIIYGDKNMDPGGIVSHARSLPFMARNRLIIVRRIEEFNADQLKKFLPYLNDPVETTCLIFISSKTNFATKFYKQIKGAGRAVNFATLNSRQVIPWIQRTAKELGLKIDGPACEYLQQIIGNRLRDLYVELEKLKLSYEKITIGVEQVRELAISTRVYTIFELLNKISVKDCAGSLTILNRYLEEENKKDAPLGIIGMLNRQMRLLWQTKTILAGGGRTNDVSKKLGLPAFAARSFIDQSRHWSEDELAQGLSLLYKADGLLKSSSRPKPVLENLIIGIM